MLEGRRRVDRQPGRACRVPAGRTVEVGELGTDQLLLRAEQDPLAHLGERLRLKQPRLVHAEQSLLGVACHR